jgi:hypothetical protein
MRLARRSGERQMSPPATAVLLAALLASLAWISPTAAQAPRPAGNVGLAQAERLTIDLKQGMTLDEVQKLLGKPRRTALKNPGYGSATESQGTLHWTYSWASQSQSERSLQVTFASKSPEQWLVSGWDWSGY